MLFGECSVDRHTALYLRRAAILVPSDIVPSDMIENRRFRCCVGGALCVQMGFTRTFEATVGGQKNTGVRCSQ